MTWARCAGCGFKSQALRKVRSHVVGCADYAALYQSAPERALEPVAEYERWIAREGSPEARKDAHREELTRTFARLDEWRETQAQRWAPRDILDDP